jgi:DNA-binding NarL/FixJ family response regulator
MMLLFDMQSLVELMLDDAKARAKVLLMEELAATLEVPAEFIPGMKELTGREREVCTLLCEGLTNNEIGERLFISETTVRHHVTSIFEKTGARGRVHLVALAFRAWRNAHPVIAELLKEGAGC